MGNLDNYKVGLQISEPLTIQEREYINQIFRDYQSEIVAQENLRMGSSLPRTINSWQFKV